MEKNLEVAKKKLDQYVKLPGVIDGIEKIFYIVEANKTPNYRGLPDGNYIVLPKGYADQLVEVDENGIPKIENGRQVPVIKPEDILYTKEVSYE